MGRLIDTSGIVNQPDPMVQGMAHFGDVLSAVMARREQRKMQEAQMRQQRELAAADDARAQQVADQQWAMQQTALEERKRAAEENEEIKRELLNEKKLARQEKFTGKLQTLAGQGAEAFASGAGPLARSQGYQMRPQMAEQPPDTSAIGGIQQMPFGPMMLAGAQQMHEQSSPLDPGGQVPDLLSALTVQRPPKPTGKFDIDYGEGETEEFDPTPFTPAARAKELSGTLSASGLPPDIAGLVAGVRATGTAKPETEFATVATPELNRRNAVKVAGMRGKKGGGGKKEPTGAQKQDDARADIGQFLSQTGYRLDAQSMRKFDQMEAVAKKAASGNSAAARVFMGQFVKYAQGEVGVLSNSDMDQFWNKAGSPLERTEEALEKLVSGSLGESKRKAAMAAIAELQGTVRARMADLRSRADEYMAPYGEDGKRRVNAFFGKPSKAAEAASLTDEMFGGAK